MRDRSDSLNRPNLARSLRRILNCVARESCTLRPRRRGVSRRSRDTASVLRVHQPIHTAQADAVGIGMHTMFFHKLVQRIRDEFDEAPDLCLSIAEASRFWALDVGACERVLTELLATGFLALGADDRYKRAAH